MRIKNLLFISAILVGFGFSSCSDDDNNNTQLRLVSSKSEIFPFEDIKVSIDLDLELLSNSYDSIRWKANGTAYGFFMMNKWFKEDDERDIRVTDYRLGKYKVYVLGYKNGIITSKDSIEYQVNKPKGDFISIKWGQSKYNQYLSYTTGTTPTQYKPDKYENRIMTEGVHLTLDQVVDGKNGEYAIFRFTPWSSSWSVRSTKLRSIPDINDFDWHQETERHDNPTRYNMEYTFHHNYLIELYGAPTLLYSGDDVTQTTLLDEYNKRFSNKLESDFYPIEIWDTPTSSICLARANNGGGFNNQAGISLVIAEPRK